ncbi:hypothetical protein [Streptomyces sp. NPDC051993]|uniref:hypothetical protein n=1 Tax=Streptomyces sp. NPDC051993 TaxID=3155286 RepID=UPI0034435478
MLLEVDRGAEDAHEVVHKLRRYADGFRLLPSDAGERIKRLARAGGSGHVDHELRLWRRYSPATGREGTPPVAFVFADTTDAKGANTVKALEEGGRRYWAPRRYEVYQRGLTARDYGQVVPVVFTVLEQLQEHGADAAVWRRLGRAGEQKLAAALDNPGGESLFRRQVAQADAEEEQQRAADREARRPQCKRCGSKFTDQRWRETTESGGAWKAGDLSVCGTCRADDIAREEAATATARQPAPVQPELEGDAARAADQVALRAAGEHRGPLQCVHQAHPPAARDVGSPVVGNKPRAPTQRQPTARSTATTGHGLRVQAFQFRF